MKNQIKGDKDGTSPTAFKSFKKIEPRKKM